MGEEIFLNAHIVESMVVLLESLINVTLFISVTYSRRCSMPLNSLNTSRHSSLFMPNIEATAKTAAWLGFKSRVLEKYTILDFASLANSLTTGSSQFKTK